MVSDYFDELARPFGISLKDVHVIHEDSAKEKLSHLLRSGQLDEEIARHVFTNSEEATCSVSNHDGPKPNCAGITMEYCRKAIVSPSKTEKPFLDVFIEEAPWTDLSVYMRGLELMRKQCPSALLRLNLVYDNGEVSTGEIVGLEGY